MKDKGIVYKKKSRDQTKSNRNSNQQNNQNQSNMPPPQIVYVVTGLGKQPLYFVENLEGKGFRILMHDEEIEKISTVYLRRAGAQYDPVQVKYMNGDLQTPNELRKQYEAEAAMMRHIDEFSDF